MLQDKTKIRISWGNRNRIKHILGRESVTRGVVWWKN